MGAVPEAVDVYERALDADPNDLKTFERIDNCVRMIDRQQPAVEAWLATRREALRN